MLTVGELRGLASSMRVESFIQQLGPFAFIQRPPSLVEATGSGDTRIAKPGDMTQKTLAFYLQFEDLSVATLPPLGKREEFYVGRRPDCDLVLSDASVSKRHAVLRWDGDAGKCTVEDLQSTNGTRINGGAPLRTETVLKDGDIISFGDEQFWFILSRSFHDKLRTSKRSSGTLV